MGRAPLTALAALVTAGTGATPAAAQLPAPPLPQVRTLAADLNQAFDDERIDAYAARFADDVHVFENGREVASTKAQWLAIVGERMKRQWVELREVNADFWSVLAVETVFTDKRPPAPGVAIECCQVGRAALYSLDRRTYKIVEVRYLVNDAGSWLAPARR